MSPEVINLLEKSIDSSISESDSIVDSDWLVMIGDSIYLSLRLRNKSCDVYLQVLLLLFLVKISQSDHEVLTSEIAMK